MGVGLLVLIEIKNRCGLSETVTEFLEIALSWYIPPIFNGGDKFDSNKVKSKAT